MELMVRHVVEVCGLEKLHIQLQCLLKIQLWYQVSSMLLEDRRLVCIEGVLEALHLVGFAVLVLIDSKSFLYMFHLILQLKVPSAQLLNLKVCLRR